MRNYRIKLNSWFIRVFKLYKKDYVYCNKCGKRFYLPVYEAQNNWINYCKNCSK